MPYSKTRPKLFGQIEEMEEVEKMEEVEEIEEGLEGSRLMCYSANSDKS